MRFFFRFVFFRFFVCSAQPFKKPICMPLERQRWVSSLLYCERDARMENPLQIYDLPLKAVLLSSEKQQREGRGDSLKEQKIDRNDLE